MRNHEGVAATVCAKFIKAIKVERINVKLMQHPRFRMMRVNDLSVMNQVYGRSRRNPDAYLVSRPRFCNYWRNGRFNDRYHVRPVAAVKADAISGNGYVKDSVVVLHLSS